ncbi:uncharacterized protein LOC113232294 [Hyposmocoma kahamanoa]|uniref:uncharacterized protein LOC113232294 n=1 Tax=Hyposmocoma kahamanoa TaxID=1477025 RepID=UPI000E6D7396|nr:uncharacterized protein LOC113232294 [Hyposmocoma kahamanoa]
MLFKAVIVLFTYVRFATSVRCFDCTSANNTMCLDPHLYDEETVRKFLPSVDCNRGIQAVALDGSSDFFCRKIVQTIFHKNYEPEVRVTRGCGWKRFYRDCYKADNEDHLETVCQCFSDDCNSSKQNSSCFSIIAIAFCMTIITTKDKNPVLIK